MDFFYGLKPCWLSSDKFYKIYVDEKNIYGAILAKQVYDEDSAMAQLIAPSQIFAPLARMWAKRLIEKRFEKEDMYDQLDKGSPDFLWENKHNFHLPKREIIECRVHSKEKTTWTGFTPISGTLYFQTMDMKKWKFILVGEQGLSQIKKYFGNAAGSR